jgi:hypothetical protein
MPFSNSLLADATLAMFPRGMTVGSKFRYLQLQKDLPDTCNNRICIVRMSIMNLMRVDRSSCGTLALDFGILNWAEVVNIFLLHTIHSFTKSSSSHIS